MPWQALTEPGTKLEASKPQPSWGLHSPPTHPSSLQTTFMHYDGYPSGRKLPPSSSLISVLSTEDEVSSAKVLRERSGGQPVAETILAFCCCCVFLVLFWFWFCLFVFWKGTDNVISFISHGISPEILTGCMFSPSSYKLLRFRTRHFCMLWVMKYKLNPKGSM